jgi:hypothetical protein
MESNDMLKKIPRKKLCLFLLLVSLGCVSCERKAAQTSGIPNGEQAENAEIATVDKTPEPEKTVPIVEGPYLNEDSVSVREPPPGIVPFNPDKDVVQNNLDLDDLRSVLTIYNWNLDFENSVIDFKADGSYSLGHRMHDGYFAYGNYEVNGISVLVRYPYKIHDGWNATDFYGPRVLDWLFDGMEDSVLVYDKSNKSYGPVTCLRSGDKILKNYALQSPYGQEYEIDRLAVIKCSQRESMVEIKENLKMRKSPDINADAVTLTVETEYYNDEGCLAYRDVTGNIVKEGHIYNYTQKTVKQDVINGVTAPWYRIVVALNNYEAANVWVFGGYLREFTPEEVREWRREHGFI